MSLRATQGIGLFIGLSALVLGFQNCSNVDFEKVQSELTKAETSPVDVSQSSIEPVEIDEVEVLNEEVVETPTEVEIPSVTEQHPHEVGQKKQKAPKLAVEGKILCGLPGPGKSVVVGLRVENAMAQNSTASAACMSVHACLNIVGAHVDVEVGVRGNGLCKEGKKNVVFISDEDVKLLVDKELLE